jgi:hypothetical protein
MDSFFENVTIERLHPPRSGIDDTAIGEPMKKGEPLPVPREKGSWY